MTPILVFSVIAIYFSVLILISYLTSRKSDSATFFTANRKSPWFLVAFGMIGASLSGVTFISVPGEVANSSFSYFQLVLGYLVGYFVICAVLLPLYYKLNLVSIYTYLEKRFGFWTYKAGGFYFLLSRTIGASFRLFLVAGVLQIAFFDAFQIPFAVTVAVTILLIWIYTFRAGIKTIVWTDTLQTLFMLSSVVISLIIIGDAMNVTLSDIFSAVRQHDYSKTFEWDWFSKNKFYTQFLSGAFIAIVMTGLDQDMMQKNLTCKTLKESQKNMFWFSVSLIPVNLLFLSLGVTLYIYAEHLGLEFLRDEAGRIYFMVNEIKYQSDDIFPYLAVHKFSPFAGIVFLLGVIAAAFSSADSALTALTTSFCVDFVGMDIDENSAKNRKIKRFTHVGFSVLIFLVILLFKFINDDSVIVAVFTFAGYTYGPLLGMFAFGIFTKIKIQDRLVPVVVLLSPILTYLIKLMIENYTAYRFGFELLMLNGALTFVGMLLLKSKTHGKIMVL